jgi:hypothetical protein
MRNKGIAPVILAALLLSWPSVAVKFEIDPDGMAVVDGQRIFILGLYENPKDDDVLAQVAEAGFSLVQSRAHTEDLDRLHEHGLWAWINTGYAIDLSEDTEQRSARLEEMADSYGRHPALLVWEVPDEALWNCWHIPNGWRSAEEPRRLREFIAAIDDKDRAAALNARLDEANRLRGIARYAESEAIAEALWEELGETSPRSDQKLSDAEARAQRMAAGMLEGYRKLRALDPDHPIWMNHAPRNQIEQLALFNQAADIVGCDIYPVPESLRVKHSDLTDRTLSSVGAYTTRMQEAAPGKPVWMVLQGFGWGDILPREAEEVRKTLREPTLHETRFMAYNAIVRGARGLLYWGTHAIPEDAPIRDHLLALARELTAWQPVLSAPDADLDLNVRIAPTYGSVDREVQVLAKDVDGRIVLIVVNEWTDPLAYSIEGLDAAEGVVYRERETDVLATVQDGALSLHIAPHAIHLLDVQ